MKDNLNLQNDNNNKSLGMKWFHFFYQVRCVFGIILSIPFALFYFALAKENPLMYLLAFLNIPVVIANIIIVATTKMTATLSNRVCMFSHN